MNDKLSLPFPECSFLNSMERHVTEREKGQSHDLPVTPFDGLDWSLWSSVTGHFSVAAGMGTAPEYYAARAIALQAVRRIGFEISSFSEACESPIEHSMLGALLFSSNESKCDIYLEKFLPGGHLWRVCISEYDSLSPSICIVPQRQIGPYRVDFLVGFDQRDSPLPASEDPEHQYLCPAACVECDGHDFHEKTKEQARKDKQRDRYLQSCGHIVLHFTGSEIHRDAIGCANEVLAALFAKVKKRKLLGSGGVK